MMSPRIVTAFALSLLPISPQFGGADLQPSAHRSRSGQWELRIVPGNRSGTAASKSSLWKNGSEAWTGELPFALRGAAVADDGAFAGYGNCAGKGACGEKHFHVLIVGPDGVVRRNAADRMEASRYLHFPPNPRAIGIFVSEERDRVVVRISDPEVYEKRHTWRTYRLSNGATISEQRLDPRFPDDFFGGFPHARPVPGTPFVLHHQMLIYDGNTRLRDPCGSRFQLLDDELEPRWNLTLEDDYGFYGEEGSDALREYVNREGAILATGPGTFSVWLAATSERVDFSVLQDRTSGEWTVRETSRCEFDPRTESREEEGPAIESFTPELLGRVNLDAPEVQRPPIRDIVAFRIGAEDQVQFIRREANGGFSAVVVDSTGALVSETAIEPFMPHIEGSSTWSLSNNGPALYAVEDWNDEGPMRTWSVDLSSGEASYLGELYCPKCPFSGVSIGDDGGFATLGWVRDNINSGDALRRFDAEGKQLWEVTDGELFSADDLLLMEDGGVAVIDVIRDVVQIWNADGSFRRTIQLEEVMGKEPNYPSSLYWDVDGGLMIDDFGGEPPYWRLGADDTVRHRFESELRNLRVAPSGTVWATDRQRFFELDDMGTVAREVGDVLPRGELQKPWGGTVGANGRIHVRDSLSDSVHVFDRDGRYLHVCTLTEDDADKLLLSRRPGPSGFVVGPRGDVYIGYGKKAATYVHFSSSGDRLGRTELGGAPAFQSATGRWWNKERGKLELVDPRGKVIASISRRPGDGRWLSTNLDLAVTPDGRAVVRSDGLAVFSADGEPVTTFELPDDESIPNILSTASDEWALLGNAYSSLALFRLTDGSIASLELPDGDERWTAGFSPEGDELWRINGSELYYERYSLPE